MSSGCVDAMNDNTTMPSRQPSCVCVCVWYGKVVPLKQTSVTKKDSLRAMALDSDNNQIQVKDIVKVVDGPHSVCVVILSTQRVSECPQTVPSDGGLRRLHLASDDTVNWLELMPVKTFRK